MSIDCPNTHAHRIIHHITGARHIASTPTHSLPLLFRPQMQLIVISNPDSSSMAAEVQVVNRLFNSGLQCLHLRKPGWCSRQISNYIDMVDPGFRKRIMLHSCHHLVKPKGLKGIHYTERTRPAAPISPISGASISTSFHKLSQLKRRDYGALDYAFLSPIFDSISKPGYSAAFEDTRALQNVLSISTLPIVALGGIDLHNIAKAKELGFWGVAVLGCVWTNNDPVRKVEMLLQECEGMDLVGDPTMPDP